MIFCFAGIRSRLMLLRSEECDWPSPSRIRCPERTMIMFSDPPLEIRGDTGIECVIGTAEDVGISHSSEIISSKF